MCGVFIVKIEFVRLPFTLTNKPLFPKSPWSPNICPVTHPLLSPLSTHKLMCSSLSGISCLGVLKMCQLFWGVELESLALSIKFMGL